MRVKSSRSLHLKYNLEIARLLRVTFHGGTIMSSTEHVRRLLAVGAICLAWAASAIAADPFTLTSTTFKDGQLMPKKVANSTSTNPNCVGENVSPQLS